MALGVDLALTNARGLNKIIFFSGLDFPMVIVPSLLGEPMLTSQAFYFLERMDSIARFKFDDPRTLPAVSEAEFARTLEYIIDNYLFEYSKKYRNSKLSSKVTEYVYTRVDPDAYYHEYDWGTSRCLIVDTYNDPSIEDCSDANHLTKDDWLDWCLFNNYFEEIHQKYEQNLLSAMRNRVIVKTKNHPTLGTAVSDLPIIATVSTPLTLEQAKMFEVVNPGRYDSSSPNYVVSAGGSSPLNMVVPQESITANNNHSAELLSYYFCALRDQSPISQFKNYYNVLEYFFEDAPRLLGRTARIEVEQIKAVVEWAVDESQLSNEINLSVNDIISEITRSQVTSSGETIPPIDLYSSDIRDEYASRLYTIRNACFHSKRTRRGRTEPRIVPATDDERIIRNELPVLQWVAIQCIERQSVP